MIGAVAPQEAVVPERRVPVDGRTSALVLLHAIGLDAGQWAWCRGLAAAGAVTLPGHGGEPLPVPAETLTLDLVADTVADGIARRSGGSVAVDLVGLSLGGMVAQRIALRHPTLVRSLVLMCTKPAVEPHAMAARAEATERRGIAALADETLARWFTPDALARPGHPGVAYARARLTRDDPAVVSAYWRAMAGHDLRTELGRVTQPVTVVAARHDVTSDLRSDAAFAALFPSGRLHTCDGPHLLCLEAPDAAEAAVADHLAWVDGFGGDCDRESR